MPSAVVRALPDTAEKIRSNLCCIACGARTEREGFSVDTANAQPLYEGCTFTGEDVGIGRVGRSALRVRYQVEFRTFCNRCGIETEITIRDA